LFRTKCTGAQVTAGTRPAKPRSRIDETEARMKQIAAFTAALLMTTAALGQSDTAANWIEIDDDALQVPGLSTTVGALDDMDVFNAAGEKIGEVDEVLGAEAATPSAVAVELEDGASDDKTVILQLTELTSAEGRLVTQMTREQLDALPDFDD
jgi:hypothetical protein